MEWVAVAASGVSLACCVLAWRVAHEARRRADAAHERISGLDRWGYL